MGEEYLAHIKHDESSNEWCIQSIEEHTKQTAILASKFASEWNEEDLGYLEGILHDIGKYSVNFQKHIKHGSGYTEESDVKADHTSAGAIYSIELLEKVIQGDFSKILAYQIAGHHAGLLNWNKESKDAGNLQERLRKVCLLNEVRPFLTTNPKLPESIAGFCGGKLTDLKDMQVWIRMMFSCLVDADYLDTELFMTPQIAKDRKTIAVADLIPKYEAYMAKFLNKAKKTPLNEIRNVINQSCISHANDEPGFFSITVPTGGGKTYASTAWALYHAKKYNKKRIIMAIPYTSIISQNAKDLRSIFGSENVIEHHSDIITEGKQQIAVDNWDTPFIVTTNVQFFESLFASRTSRCRKLHNIANSVVILDEAQMLPPEFLKPILNMLQSLVKNFGVSVLFSTATQPVFSGKIGSRLAEFSGLPEGSITEIAGNVEQLANKLKRVEIKIPHDNTSISEWVDIATEMKKHEQVLCIVSTRKDCRELYDLLPDNTIHLSRMMCSEHIDDTIQRIKKLLKAGKPIRVVSTQLIECGVNIDFPVVFRAYAGLDSIAQSAGRCNREGNLNAKGKLGKVTVFIPQKLAPPGFLRKGCDALTEILDDNTTDYLSPTLFRKYFKQFYSSVNNFDKADIYDKLEKNASDMHFQFAAAAREFKLISDDGSTPIIVEYGDALALKEKWRVQQDSYSKTLLRKLQRYTVSVRQKDFEELKNGDRIEEINGVWFQNDTTLYAYKSVGMCINSKWNEETGIY